MPESAIARRTRRQGDEAPALTKDALITVLLDLTQREGAQAINMRRVAECAGVSPRWLYNFVRDKEEMVDLLCEAIINDVAPERPAGTWRERLTTLARNVRLGASKYPGVALWMLSRTSSAEPTPSYNRVGNYVRDALKEAGLRGKKLEAAHLSFSVMTLGGIIAAEGIMKVEPETTFDDVEDQLARGLQLIFDGIG